MVNLLPLILNLVQSLLVNFVLLIVDCSLSLCCEPGV